MLRGIYTAASGMLSVQVATDTLANNIANVNTVGYKTRYAQYQASPEVSITRMQNNERKQVGELTTGVDIIGTPIHFSQGHLQATANPLDIAIDGDGLFAVQLPSGEIGYTRNGSLKLNQNNELVIEGGAKLLDENNTPIVMPKTLKKVVIQEDGSIRNENGAPLAQLRMVTFSNLKGLHKMGDSIFKGENPIELGKGQGGRIMQGYLEGSNTNVVHEMIQNITGLRLYESLQKSISTQSKTLEKTINEIQ
jgi:flagellar basal-body rod protein FlgF